MWSIRTKQKLKKQNCSRITEPKNGLKVTKGLGRMGGKGGRRGIRSIMMSTHDVAGDTGKATQHREDKW